MSATILLARHGSHDEVGIALSGRSEIALNRQGRDEAARLAARLASVPLTAIQASPRRRAQETAVPAARCHALPVETVDALDEIDFGAWTGRRFTALAGDADWDRWNVARATARVPGGETMAEAIARARGHVERLAGVVLCVGHCDVIRGLIATWLGMGLERMLAFDCDPGSLTTVTIDGGHVRLVALNERCA